MKKLLNSQEGIAPVIFIILAGIIALGVIIFNYYRFVQMEKKSNAIPASISEVEKKFKDCESRDYGGCDEEPNFYEWKDDGLP
jgi:hypothetical protein